MYTIKRYGCICVMSVCAVYVDLCVLSFSFFSHSGQQWERQLCTATCSPLEAELPREYSSRSENSDHVPA